MNAPGELTPEQHERRARGVGSSDAAAAIGLNPYFSAAELWMQKTGQTPAFEGNEATRWGKLLEPAVRQEYAEQTGRVIHLPPDTLVHAAHDFVVCHPDGVTDDRRLYEGKTARYDYGWGEPGTDDIPEQYVIQVQHAMMVTTYEIADVAVLIGGQDFRIYTVEADADLQAAILEAETEFWDAVRRGVCPAVDFESPRAMTVLKKLYPGTSGEILTATAEMETWRMVLEHEQHKHKAAEENAKAAKARLLDFMGEASVLRFADGRALRRKALHRKAYSVEAADYIDSRFVNAA